MKRSKFTEAQIAFILRQGEEGTAVGEICRRPESARHWRKKYGGLMPSEMKRLRQLEVPKAIRVDQGTEFVSRDLDLWAISAASRSTSPDRASPLTTPSSSRSTANSERNV